jgi:hypothetical protein
VVKGSRVGWETESHIPEAGKESRAAMTNFDRIPFGRIAHQLKWLLWKAEHRIRDLKEENAKLRKKIKDLKE